MFDDIFLFLDYKNFFKDSTKHFQQRIGPGEDGVNINHILDKNNIELPVFIKIDIENLSISTGNMPIIISIIIMIIPAIYLSVRLQFYEYFLIDE